MDAANTTLTVVTERDHLRMPALELVVSSAPERASVVVPLGLVPVTLGSDASVADAVVPDARVSRAHCTFALTPRGVVVRDLGSKNGTFIGPVRVVEAIIGTDVAVGLAGAASVAVRIAGDEIRVPLSREVSFGDVLGGSAVMRALFAYLSRAAQTDETVLLLGESGSGKDVLAQAMHDASARAAGPFVPFDCGAVSASLVETALFGHARGAFTGADVARDGALAAAAGGTLFLDEIGELPLDLQPRLLRVLEARQYQPVGSAEWRPFTGRVIAATHRDLRRAVAEGTFRQDLFFRLAVVTARVPPLRERPEDIELLAERFLGAMDPPKTLDDLPIGALEMLRQHSFPGNVRELKNVVTRLVLFPNLLDEAIERLDADGPRSDRGDRYSELLDLPLREARDHVVARFERTYVEAKLQQAKGNVTKAATAMGVSRQFLHRLMQSLDVRSR